MAERVRQSALAQVLRAGRSGVLEGSAGVELVEVLPAAMVQIHGAVDAARLHKALGAFALTRVPAPLECSSGTQLRLLWNGPHRYLAVSAIHAPEVLVATLAEALLESACSCVDVSHASCVLRLQGPSAQALLAKGCALDLQQMREQSCAPTAIGRFDVLLHCIRDDTFELFVARSLAQSCAHWLLRAGAEYGVSVRA